MTTRTITGTVKAPDDTVYTGVALTFTLDEEIISSGVLVERYAVEITTETDGTFETALYVPDTGTALYHIILTNGEQYDFNFSIGAAVTLDEIISVAVTASESDYWLNLTSEYNVKSYGAIGNGIADDTAAIQAAIDAAASTSGRVFIPAGYFIIKETINLPLQTSIVGHGHYTSILQAWGDFQGAMIKVTDTNYTGETYIHNIGLFGDNKAHTGIEYNHTGNSYLNPVRIQDCIDYGMLLNYGVWGIHAENVNVGNCGNGLYATIANGQVNHNIFNKCKFLNSVGAGAKLNGGIVNRFMNCDFSYNGSGGVEEAGVLQIGGGQGLEVSGCYFETNGKVALENGVQIQIGDVNNTHHVPTITKNYFYGGDGVNPGWCKSAIQLQNTLGAVIEGNRSSGHADGSLVLLTENTSYRVGSNSFTENIVGA